MSSTITIASRSTGTQGTSSTTYFPVAGTLGQAGTETVAQQTFRTAGTLKNLYFRVIANTITATSTVRSRVNTANGAQSASIGSSTTGEFEDTSNTDTISAGDEANGSLTTGATGTTITPSISSFLFDATTNTTSKLGTDGQQDFSQSTASTTWYWAHNGVGGATTTEVNVKYTCRTAGTMANGFVSVATNGRSTASTFRHRLNTANGTIAASITASTTGFFEDTSNTDSVASGDLTNKSITTGTGTGTLAIGGSSMEFTTTNGASILTGWRDSTNTIAQSLTRYLPIGGRQTIDSTESNQQTQVRVAGTASNLQAYISQNNINNTSTGRFRINAGNGNQTFSIGASTTGAFEDTTNSDTLAATDDVAYSYTTGADPGTITVQIMGMLYTVAQAGATAFAGRRMLMGIGM